MLCTFVDHDFQDISSCGDHNRPITASTTSIHFRNGGDGTVTAFKERTANRLGKGRAFALFAEMLTIDIT